MGRISVLAVVMFGSLGSVAEAASKFPYEAIVQSESTVVRSQPSTKAPGTLQLPKGTKVVVYSHQPGGWYKIVPPEGSFSLIRADLVDMRAGTGTAIVLKNGAPAYVGSTLGRMNTGVHNKLSTNDEVTILGAVSMNTQRGPIKMFKIEPPAYEYRWIEGKTVIPASQVSGQQKAVNPFEIATQSEEYSPAPQKQKADPFAQQSVSKQKTTTVVRSQPKLSNSKGVRRSAPAREQIEADRLAIKQLDQQFREMIDLDPASWDLEGLEVSYRGLQETISHQAIASQIDLRLAAVERYKKTKAEFDDFIQLTAATSQRETELLNEQKQIAASKVETPVSGSVSGEPVSVSQGEPQGNVVTGPEMFGPTLLAPNSENVPPVEVGVSNGPQLDTGMQGPAIVAPNSLPSAAGDVVGAQPKVLSRTVVSRTVVSGPSFAGSELGSQPTAVSSPNTVANEQTVMTAPETPEFDGAGIIQKAINKKEGLPQHVLVSPQGKIISYVQPRGKLDLDKYVGQSMGIQGETTFRPELKRHVLVIDRMMPVTLTR